MDTLEVKAWLSGARPEREIRGLMNSVERYASLIQEHIDELQARAAEVRAVIEAVPHETQRRVLECRYLDGMTIEQTADALSYCVKSVNRYHAAALESVKSILDRMERTPCLTPR